MNTVCFNTRITFSILSYTVDKLVDMFQTKATVYTLFIGSTQLYLLDVFIYFYTFSFISGIRSWTGNSLLQRWRYLPVSDGPVLPSSTRERPCVPEAAIQSHHIRPRGARLVHQWRDVDFQHGLPVPPLPQKKRLERYGQAIRTDNDAEGWHNGLNRRTSGSNNIHHPSSTSWYSCWNEKLSCVPCKSG